MKNKILIFAIFVLLNIGCNDSKNSIYSNEEIENILKKNQEKQLFLSFYPDMEDEIFKYVSEKEIENGNLVLGNNNKVDTWDNPPIYQFSPHGFEKHNFRIYSLSNYVSLYYFRQLRAPIHSINENTYIRSRNELNNNLSDIMEVYRGIYGQHKEIVVWDKVQSVKKNVFKYEGNNKIVIVENNYSESRGMFTGGTEGGVHYSSHVIEIDYYSIESFSKEMNELKTDSINVSNRKKQEIENKITKEEERIQKLNDQL